MRKFLFIYLLFVFTFSCRNETKQSNSENLNFEGLGIILEAYYYNYFEYPSNINQLISYTEGLDFPDRFDSTIKRIKESDVNIKVIIKNDKYLIINNNEIIYETKNRTVCDDFFYNPNLYLGRLLFFDEKQELITNDYLHVELKKHIRLIQKNYSKIEKETKEKSIMEHKYVFFQYDIKNGLTRLCDNEIDYKFDTYLSDIEICLNGFSRKNNIYKIVFSTPMYYN